VASPARSIDQCTRCHRTGAVKVTVCLGERKWRFCANCVSRGDKTTRLDAGHAPIATVLSVGLISTVLVSIAGATGKLDDLLPHPAPNGFSLLVLLVLAAGVLWRLNGRNEKWPADVEPLAFADWPDTACPDRDGWDCGRCDACLETETRS
jgi:hypothetical protein